MKKLSIVVADDNHGLTEALRIRLEASGYDVHTSADGYQALAIARQVEPAVVLLDVNMPAGDGFSVHERMANIPELCDVPVIYITGDASEDVDRMAEKQGAYAVLRKPILTEYLLATIEAAVNREPSEADRIVI